MSQRSFKKDILGVFGSNLFSVLLGFVIGVIISRELGPAGRGTYAAILVIPGLFASIALLGTRQSAIYFTGKKVFDDEKIVSSILVTLIFSTIAGSIISIGFYLASGNTGFYPELILIALLTIPTRLISIYLGGFFLGKENFKASNIIRMLPVILQLLFVVLFLYVFHMDVMGALLALFAANFLVLFYALYLTRKYCRIRFAIHKEVLRSMVKMGILYAISVFVMQLNYRVDIVLLENLSTAEEIGYYALAVSLATQIWQIPIAMGTVIRSRTANAPDVNLLNQSVNRLLRLSILACLVAAIVLYFIVPFFIPLIYGKEFTNSIEIVRAIIPGILLFVLFKILNSRISGMGRPDVTLKIFIPALILNIILNLIWIPDFGGIGAAWATNFSYGSGAIALLLVYSQMTKTSLLKIFTYQRNDLNSIIKLKKIE